MTYQKQQEAKRLLLHIQARALSCAFTLRDKPVPIKLKRILAATSSLDALEKYNPNWQSQPRIPAGDPNGGQWTNGGSSSGGTTTTKPKRPTINDIHDPPLESVYPVEMLIGGLGALSVRGALAAIRVASGAARAIYSGVKIQRAAKAIEEYFGGKPKTDTNDAGDVFMIRGDKKIRFDIKNPHGEEPHFHIETKPSSGRGRWPDTGTQHRHIFKGKE